MRAPDDVGEPRGVTHEEGERRRLVRDVAIREKAEERRQARLRVEIHREGAIALERKILGEVNRGARLADATFEVGNGDDRLARTRLAPGQGAGVATELLDVLQRKHALATGGIALRQFLGLDRIFQGFSGHRHELGHLGEGVPARSLLEIWRERAPTGEGEDALRDRGHRAEGLDADPLRSVCRSREILLQRGLQIGNRGALGQIEPQSTWMYHSRCYIKSPSGHNSPPIMVIARDSGEGGMKGERTRPLEVTLGRRVVLRQGNEANGGGARKLRAKKKRGHHLSVVAPL